MIALRLLFVFMSNIAFNIWVNYEAYDSLHHYKTNHLDINDEVGGQKYKDGLIVLITFTVVGGLFLIATPFFILYCCYMYVCSFLLNCKNNTASTRKTRLKDVMREYENVYMQTKIRKYCLIRNRHGLDVRHINAEDNVLHYIGKWYNDLALWLKNDFFPYV